MLKQEKSACFGQILLVFASQAHKDADRKNGAVLRCDKWSLFVVRRAGCFAEIMAGSESRDWEGFSFGGVCLSSASGYCTLRRSNLALEVLGKHLSRW